MAIAGIAHRPRPRRAPKLRAASSSALVIFLCDDPFELIKDFRRADVREIEPLAVLRENR